MLLGIRSGMWDGNQMGEPESGSVLIFRWNNIEKATSQSASQQHNRGGTVGVSACCLLSVPTPTARRLPDGKSWKPATISIHLL